MRLRPSSTRPGTTRRSSRSLRHQLRRAPGPHRPRGSGAEVRRELEDAGIVIKTASVGGLAEEAPYAYKDVADVVGVVDAVGLSRKVARMRPFGVLKG